VAAKFWIRASALLVLAALLVLPETGWAQGLPMVTASQGPRGTQYSITLQLLALMTVLTLLPSLLLMMTSFVRIIIVMSLLRQIGMALEVGEQVPHQIGVEPARAAQQFVGQRGPGHPLQRAGHQGTHSLRAWCSSHWKASACGSAGAPV
jgi:flagellar biosynthesis protein FliP